MKNNPRTGTTAEMAEQVGALAAYDELRGRLADLEALVHAAHEIVLPWVADRDGRRDLARLGAYLALLADLSQRAVEEAEVTAARLMRPRPG